MSFTVLKELNEEVNILSEGTGDAKRYFIEGVFLQGNIKNRNRRMYPKDILQREVDRYTKEYIDQKRAFGELGHPDGSTINLERVSHMIERLKESGNDYEGRAKIITTTPMGKITQALLDEGARLGVSSRGIGSLKLNREGINEVQDDFLLATAADIVADPSAPDAFVRGIMENRDWSLLSGIWSEEDIDNTKKTIHSATRQQLEEVTLHVFENFLKRL
jgi:hypothetical protein